MSHPDLPGDDERFDELLADYDEALAQGRPFGAATTVDDFALRDRLAEAQACLQLLEATFPRHPESTNDDRTGETTSSVLFPAPATIGRFLIRSELGRGGHGVVFLAFDPKLKREVALKVPRPEIVQSASMRARFRREAEAAARLDHPNLIPLHEAGEIGPVCYLVCAYCPGPTLAVWQRSQAAPMTPTDAARVIAPLADALGYMHARGVLHRDIKPANVILHVPEYADGDSQSHSDPGLGLECAVPKITDFGLACFADETSAQTRTGAIMGTAGYMAPEQAQGRREDIGPATDVYALGVMLYELIVGQVPFRGPTELETFRQIVSDAPPMLHDARRNVPRDLETIILKCLEKSPARRYANGSELADDLRRFLTDEPIHGRRPSPWERCRRWIQRRPKQTIAAAALLLMIATVISARSWVVDARRGKSAALDQLRQQVELSEARTHQLNAQLASVDYPKGTMQAWQAWSKFRDWREMGRILESRAEAIREFNLAGFEWHYLRHLMPDPETDLSGHHYYVDPIAVSGDGGFLLSSARDNRIRLWDLHGRSSRTLTAGTYLRGDYPRFSPDGSEVAYYWNQDGKGNIGRWEVPEGRQLSLWKLDHPLTDLRYLPDAKEILFDQKLDAGQQLIFRKLNSSDPEQPDRPLFAEGRIRPIEGFFPIQGGSQLLVSTAPRADSRQFTVSVVDANTGGAQFDCFSLGLVGTDPPSRATELVVSPDETYVAALSNNRQVCWGKIEPNAKPLTFTEYLALFVQFADDGKTLAIGVSGYPNRSARIVFLDTETGALKTEWKLASLETWSIATSPDWQTVYQGTDAGTIQINRRRSPDNKFVLAGHSPAETWGLAFSPDGRRLVSGGDDGSVRIWDPETLRLEKTLTDHTSLVTKVAYSPDGRTVAGVDFEGKAILWESARWEKIREFQAPVGPLRAIAFSPNSAQLAFGGQFRQLWLWHPSEVSPGRIYPEFAAEKISSLVFSPDGQRLFATTDDTKLRSVTLNTGESTSHPLAAQSLAIAANGPKNLLAVGLESGLIQFFDLDPFQGIGSYQAHSHTEHKKSAVIALAFSPDGRTLASGGMDGTVRLWHVDTRQELLRFDNIPCQVNHLAFAPDNLTLAAALHNGEIWLWRAK